jgi:hypothetical protein
MLYTSENVFGWNGIGHAVGMQKQILKYLSKEEAQDNFIFFYFYDSLCDGPLVQFPAQLSGTLEQVIQTCRVFLPKNPENQCLLSLSSREALTHLVNTAQEVKR